MYEYTDKVILYLNKRYIEQFSALKALLSLDEINLLKAVNKLYDQLVSVTRRMYILIAQAEVRRRSGSADDIDGEWVDLILEGYDPVSKYVFVNEVGRRRSKLFEALVASNQDKAEADAALRAWAGICAQFAITVTDEASKQGMKQAGVERVVWKTENDERRCTECGKRDGKVYDIDSVPPKPHMRCRCWLEPE